MPRLLLVLLCGLVLTACDLTTAPPPTPAPTQTPVVIVITATPDPLAVLRSLFPTPGPEPTATTAPPTLEPVQIGTPTTGDVWQVTVEEASANKTFGEEDGVFHPLTAQGVYAIVLATVKNTTNTQQVLNAADWNLVDPTGARYPAKDPGFNMDQIAAIGSLQRSSLGTEVLPRTSVPIAVLFDVAPDAPDLGLVLEVGQIRIDLGHTSTPPPTP